MVPTIGGTDIIDWEQQLECNDKCFILLDAAIRSEAHHEHHNPRPPICWAILHQYIYTIYYVICYMLYIIFHSFHLF